MKYLTKVLKPKKYKDCDLSERCGFVGIQKLDKLVV